MLTKEEMHSVAQDIIGSYEARMTGITSLREQVATQRQAAQAQLGDLDGSHQALAQQLRADLNKAHADLTRAEAQRRSQVNAWMEETSSAHQAMAQQLQADLGKAHADLTRAEAQRHSQVNAWMKELAIAHAEAHDEWQVLSATMKAYRGLPVVEVKPPEIVAPLTEEGAVAGAQVAEVTPEMAGLRDPVFKYLANHPDGTRLVELEQEFGGSRIQMARVLRNLMDENKVEKRNSHYFAI